MESENESQFVYMPLPKSQPIPVNGVPCDHLLVYDIQAAQISTHSSSFKITGMSDVCVLLYRLFLTLVEVCCKYQLPFAIETVPDGIFYHPMCCDKKLSAKSNIKGYRMWIPLTREAATAFTTQFNVLFNQQASGKSTTSTSTGGHRKKRRKTDEPEQTQEEIENSPLRTFTELNNAFTLYFRGEQRISVTFDEGTGNVIPDNHILSLLDATRYFALKTTKRKHMIQKCPVSVSMLHSYKKLRYIDENNVIHTELDNTIDNPRDIYIFDPDPAIVETGTIRWLTTGNGSTFIRQYSDLFKYAQPHYIPTKHEVLSVIRRMSTATGEPFSIEKYATMTVNDIVLSPGNTNDCDNDISLENIDCDEDNYDETTATVKRITDPAFFAPIPHDIGNILSENETSKGKILRQIYPLIAQIQLSIKHSLESARRIAKHENNPSEIYRQTRESVDAVYTLIDKHHPGIPSIYHKIVKFAADRKLSILTEKDDDNRLAREMVYTMPSYEERYDKTLMTYRTSNLYLGAKDALRYTDGQCVVFVMAHSRCMDTTLNKLGHTTNICIAGPTGSGKSHVAKGVMDCLPPEMQTTIDSSSEKAHLGHSESDLTVSFVDEMKITDPEKNGISKSELSLYTQMAEGVVSGRRLVPAPSGGYVVQIFNCASRGISITCSNLIHLLQKAMMDRLLVATLPRIENDCTGTGIVTEDADSSVALTRAFKKSLQYQTALQVRYTCLNAFEILEKIDMTMFIVFFLMMEKEHGVGILRGRNLIEIRNAAMAECVKEVVYLWNICGIGADNEFRTDREAIFYNTRSVLTMQHIITAFTNITQLTTTTSYIQKIVLRMKTMIMTDTTTPNYVLSNDNHYYVLQQTPKNFWADLKRELSDMGEGILETVVETLSQKKTNGFLNIKNILVQNQEHVCLNRYFAATIRNPCEEAVVKVLKEYADRVGTSFITYDEEKIGYRADLKERILYPWVNSMMNNTDTTLRWLAPFTRSEIIQATDVLSSTVDEHGIFLWEDVTNESVQAADICRDPISQVTEPMTTRSGMHKKPVTELAPLLIHPSFFAVGVTINGKYDDTIRKCMLYAGSYKEGSNIWGGVYVNMDDNTAKIHYIKAAAPTDYVNNADVLITNPLHIPEKTRVALFEDKDVSSLCNTIFPIEKSHITLTGLNGCMEDQLTVTRFRKLYNPCEHDDENQMQIINEDGTTPLFPDDLYGMDPRWLPSNTTYLSSTK